MALYQQGTFQQDLSASPDVIRKKRQMIQDMLTSGGQAQTIGEGIGDFISGIAGYAKMKELDKAEQAGLASGQEAQSKIFDAMMGGARSTPAAMPASAPATVSGLQSDIVSDVLNAGPQKQGGMDWLKYSNQGATRNLPVSEKLAKSLSFLPELGVQAEVFSGGQPAKGTSNKRVGSTRHDHGEAADVFFYKDGRKLDWSNPQDVPVYQEIVRKAKERGIAGFGAGEGYMQPGSMHIGFGTPGVWGAGGSGRNAASWLREAYGGAPAQAPMPTFAQAAASPTATQTSMVGAGQGNRMGVAQALSGNTQVASLDPSVGMAYAAPQAQSGADKVFSAIMPQTQQAAPQMPARGGSGLDVWQGRATQGTATDGTQLTRLPSGEIQRTNRFGVTERMSPEGGASAMVGGGARPQMQPQQVAQTGPMQAPMTQAPMPSQPQQGGVDLRAILEAAQNPNTPPEVRKMALDFIQNEQMKQTPEYANEQRMKQLQLQEAELKLAQMQNPGAKIERVGDRIVKINPDNTVTEVYAAPQPEPEKPTDVREYEYAKNQGFTGSFVDFQLAQKKAGASQVNVGEGDKFYENLDKKNAEMFAAMSDTGVQAASKLAQVDRLENLLKTTPQGFVGAVKQLAGDYGIITDGLSDIQATSALLEKLVPAQRPPGSGTMSDADIQMFRRSLPRIINQPGGNAIILGTMRGIAQYEQQLGDIADMVANREITAAEGRKMIKQVKNPLSNFGQMEAKPQATPQAAPGAPAVGTIQDGYKFKGGSPSDPNSWEKVQ